MPAASDTGASVTKNVTSVTVDDPGNSIHWKSGDLSFHPGSDDTYTVIRWTAPSNGKCMITAAFEHIDENGGSSYVYIKHNDVVLYEIEVTGYLVPQSYSSASAVTTSQGDTIDFIMGCGGGGWWEDSTKIDAQIVFAQ